MNETKTKLDSNEVGMEYLKFHENQVKHEILCF